MQAPYGACMIDHSVLFRVIRAFRFRLTVSSVFCLIIQFCVRILPGNKTILAPFFRTNHSEVLYVSGTPLVFKVDIHYGSADSEEHAVFICRIQIEVYILKILICTQRCNTMNIIMGCIGYIKTDTASDSFQNDAMFTAFIGIMLLETAEFDLNCFSYLQSYSPFLMS